MKSISILLALVLVFAEIPALAAGSKKGGSSQPCVETLDGVSSQPARSRNSRNRYTPSSYESNNTQGDRSGGASARYGYEDPGSSDGPYFQDTDSDRGGGDF